MKNGFMTYREAKKFVAALFEACTNELKKSKVLELPIGTLTLVEPKPRRAYKLGMIVKTHTKPKVHFKKKAK